VRPAAAMAPATGLTIAFIASGIRTTCELYRAEPLPRRRK